MKTARPHACNVLNAAEDQAQLWQFNLGTGHAELAAEQIGRFDAPLPPRLVTKTWRSLFQPKLNIAWLPPEHVFLRVIQLPTTEASEIPAMLELQLEKLSPLPVAQIVWSYELVTRPAEAASGQQTVIVIIASRAVVEEFLGKLDAQGYMADRLDLPFLHELLTTRIEGDGVWVFVSPAGQRRFCLMAWWYGGVLQSLNLLHVTEGENWGAVIRDKISQIAWAGEIEGWLTTPPRYTLVADAATAAEWVGILRETSDETVREIVPLKNAELAALTAERAASGGSRVNLLPAEHAARYKQQFIDRLWMRGLGALVLIYLAGVLVYFAALQVARYRGGQVSQELAAISGSFTNALKLKARIQVLQEQSNLRFAALDCWKAVTETLPAELTLTSVTFQRGKTLTLTGTAPEASQVTDYMEALNRATTGNATLFSRVNLRNSQSRPGPQGQQTVWNIECELQRQETL